MEQKLLNDSTNTKIPVYTKSWFVILMLILFFPVGLCLMWIYKKNWNIIIKVLITAFFASFFIMGFVDELKSDNSASNETSFQSSSEIDNSVMDITSTENSSEKATTSVVPQTTAPTTTHITTTTPMITTTTQTITTEPLEIKSPDEFIYNDKLYSINNLTLDEVKNTFSGLTEMDETIVKNDDIGFVCDNSGNINIVFLFNDNGSFFKNINAEMSSAEIENILGSASADEEGELWLLDSEGNVVYDATSPYYIQLMEDESLGTVLMLCRTDTAMESEAKGVSELYIGYEGNDILPDLDNVTVYLDDKKLFTLQQGDVEALLYNNDGKMHTLRIENTVAQYVTNTSAEIQFRCLPVNGFCISSNIDDGYSVSDVSQMEEHEFNESFPNTNITLENIYVLTDNKVFSAEEYLDYCIKNEINSAIIDSIKEWF